MGIARTAGIAAGIGVVLFGACACGPVPDYRTLAEADLKPPTFLGVDAVDSRTIRLRFDETVSGRPADVTLVPSLPVDEVVAEDKAISIKLSADEGVGVDYALEASVEDAHRNSMAILCHVYGYNPEVPPLLINEFTNRGSGNHPDLVELYARGAGNLAGVCLFEGSRDHWEQRIILPAIKVVEGDYLLIHWKPQGLPEEKNEVTDKSSSGGYDSSPTAYDLWVPDGDGLVGTTGALSLYTSPTGRLLDAVLYSDRTSKSDNSYAGFGSKEALDTATQLWEAGGWKAAGAAIAPEDCVNPDPSTATRSLCRSSSSADTDGSADWHVTPTRGSTFGGPNSDELYVPTEGAASVRKR